MSKKIYDTDWICDICGKTLTQKNYPESFCQMTINSTRGGFYHSMTIDACCDCMPKDLF